MGCVKAEGTHWGYELSPSGTLLSTLPQSSQLPTSSCSGQGGDLEAPGVPRVPIPVPAQSFSHQSLGAGVMPACLEVHTNVLYFLLLFLVNKALDMPDVPEYGMGTGGCRQHSRGQAHGAGASFPSHTPSATRAIITPRFIEQRVPCAGSKEQSMPGIWCTTSKARILQRAPSMGVHCGMGMEAMGSVEEG